METGLEKEMAPQSNILGWEISWATSQLSVALAPATACTSLRAGCSLANTTGGSGDKGGYTGSETPTQSGWQPRAKTTWMGRWGVG